MQPPPDWAVAPQAQSAPRERGFLLSGVLLIGLVGNIFGCGANLLAGAAASGAAKNAASSFDTETAATARHLSQTLHFLALVALCNVVFLTAAWMWKKWGLYGYAGFMLFGALVGFKDAPVTSVVTVLWGVVIGAIVASKWKQFE
jgi:hypothetical protein